MANVSVIKLKVRRGLDSERKLVTFDQGEIGYVTDTQRLFVGDGKTLGGNSAGMKYYTDNIVTPSPLLSKALIGDIIFDNNTSLFFVLTGSPYTSYDSYKPFQFVYSTLYSAYSASTIGSLSPTVTANISPLLIQGSAKGSSFQSLWNNYAGVSASADITLYNDLFNGIDYFTSPYLDLGIASSQYNGNIYSPTFNVVQQNDSYLYSKNGDMVIGATTPGANSDIILFAGGTLSGTKATGGNEVMRLTNTAGTYAGNVGIGTSIPNATLTVSGTISATGVTTSSLSSRALTVSGTVSAISVSTLALSSRFINLEHSTPNDGINPVLFIGERGDGSGGTVIGSLSGFNTIYDEINNKLIVSTQFGAIPSLTAVAIDSSGNVGIGTITPNTALTVSGTISATSVTTSALSSRALTVSGTISAIGIATQSLSSRFINLEHTTPNDGINPVLFIGERGDGSGGTVIGSLSGFNTTYDETGNKLSITTQFGSITPLTAVIIDSVGSVGIGTSTPNTTLTVVGSVSATGGLSASNLTVYGNISAQGIIYSGQGVAGAGNSGPYILYPAATGSLSASIVPLSGGNIATGYNSSILGGSNNRVLSAYSFIAGGSANYTAFPNTFILGTGLSGFQTNFTYVNNISSQGIVTSSSSTIAATNSAINAFNTNLLTIVGAASGSVFGSVQNLTTGLSARTDISIYNDQNNYIDLGIASSQYNGNIFGPVFNTVKPGDGYLYTTNNNIAIGTAGTGGINLFTGGTLSGSNTRMTISSAGDIAVYGSLSALGSLSANNYYGNTALFSTVSALSVSASSFYGNSNQTVMTDGTSTVGNGPGTIALNYLNGIYLNSSSYVNGNLSAASFNTLALSSRYINLEHSIPNDGINPVLFIGERGDGSVGTVAGSLSGFNTTYDEVNNKLIVSTQFGAIAPLTAVSINSIGNVGINTTAPNQVLTVNGNLSATSVFASNGIGYTTGSGGTVTQLVTRQAGVTLNKPTGTIVLVASAATFAYNLAPFTLTNSYIGLNDIVFVQHSSSTNLAAYGLYTFTTSTVAGSATINVRTLSAMSTDTPTLQYTVIKSAVS